MKSNYIIGLCCSENPSAPGQWKRRKKRNQPLNETSRTLQRSRLSGCVQPKINFVKKDVPHACRNTMFSPVEPSGCVEEVPPL
ncbi:hypothetical protein TNCV_2743811 [Trichonephila clavipes]|nr:hypothetical protein TNCV_2743811 [Trichonephila clavipes]